MRSVEAYLPLYRERVKWTDRTVVTERPLFSGYVFTRFSPEARLTVISTPGVLRSLGEEQKDLVSSDELERIQTALTKGYPLRPHPHVVAGTRVRVRSGVFAGVEGTVTELRHECKVIIGLAAVRQCFSLELGLRDLEVLPE
jgi:transcription antitermination factor NusG